MLVTLGLNNRDLAVSHSLVLFGILTHVLNAEDIFLINIVKLVIGFIAHLQAYFELHFPLSTLLAKHCLWHNFLVYMAEFVARQPP
jgi:hypothetical protein